MCILYMLIRNAPAADGYQLVLANNRDEHYTRPTKPAGRWTDHTHCISGLDEEPGREGGTWLGLSEKGKLASLLNILTKYNQLGKKGRGFLVTDFLSGDVDAKSYTAPLARDRKDYNPFNLVLLEKRSQKWNLHFFSSDDEQSPLDLDIENESVHAFGNSTMSVPWQKVSDGKERFREIIQSHPTTQDKADLTASLLTMLNDQTPHFPDAQLQSQALDYLDDEATVQRSAYCVRSPQIQYGTRTNTLVFVDAQGNGEYMERTMREPIDAESPAWDTNTISFKMEST